MESPTVFRPPQSTLWTGVAYTAVFLSMGVVSVWAAWTNADGSFKYPQETAAFFAAFWGGWTLLGLAIVYSYCRLRVLLWPDRVRIVATFSTRDVIFGEVTKLEWVGNRSSKVTFFNGSDRIATIDFTNVISAGRTEIMSRLRANIPESIQVGWCPFEAVNTPTPERALLAAAMSFRLAVICWVFGIPTLAVGIWNPFDEPKVYWGFLAFGILLFGGGVFFSRLRQKLKADARRMQVTSFRENISSA